MGIPIDKKEVYSMRYPAGTIIELTEPINDQFTPKPIGSRFMVESIDDVLQLHGHWLSPEKGSMAVSIEEDKFKIVVEDTEDDQDS